MSSIEKRKSGVLAPDGAKSGLALGVMTAPLAVWALAALLPGGFFIWAIVMLVAAVVVY